jgi:hypothetical protein
MRNSYTILIGNLEGKKLLERSRRIWEDNIKMDLSEKMLESGEWIRFTQDRDRWLGVTLVVMNLQIP